MTPPLKPTLENFIKTCTPLLKIPELEKKMRKKVHEIVSKLLCFEAGEDAKENVTRFLREDDTFFGVMLSMVNLSQEKFLRILTAERFADGDFGSEWGINQVIRKIQRDDDFAEKVACLLLEGRENALLAEKVACLLLEGRENALLAEKVADFYLDQLSLLDDWTDVIRNEGAIARIVRKKLMGEYTDAKGEFIEARIRGVLDKLKKEGITYERGQVPLLGKEADHAIPSCANPLIVIMSSYQETTSSSQTTRANEQRQMFSKLRDDNERYPKRKQRILINFTDGGGWLARRSDLAKIYASCDYCINMNTLEQLTKIVRYHIKTQ